MNSSKNLSYVGILKILEQLNIIAAIHKDEYSKYGTWIHSEFVEYKEPFITLFKTLTDEGFLLWQYDCSTWIKNNKKLYDNAIGIKKCSFLDMRILFTCYLRNDRFCTGYLLSIFRNGVFNKSIIQLKNILENKKYIILAQDSIIKLFDITTRLKITYRDRKSFTIDGRMLGDIGEIIAEENYDIRLNMGLTEKHDAITPEGLEVQIKTTMKDYISFPAYEKNVPNILLVISITEIGIWSEEYNGSGKYVWDIVKNRKIKPKNGMYSIPIERIKKIIVNEEDGKVNIRKNLTHASTL